MLNLLSILEAGEHFQRTGSFYKKRGYMEIRTQVKSGFQNNMYLVFSQLFLLSPVFCMCDVLLY